MFKFKKKTKHSISEDNLKYYIINGILFTLMQSLSRTYAAKFLYRIGGTDFHNYLFNALPGLVAVFATIPGIIWLGKTRERKNTMVSFFFGSRIFSVFFAIVPFLPEYSRPMIFVLLYSAMNLPETASVTALQTYAGDIFMPNERANGISLRNKFSTLAQILVMLLMGEIMKLGGNSNRIVIYIYQAFFLISFILGLMEIRSFKKLRELPSTSSNSSGNNISFRLKDIINSVKKNKKFIYFMSCSLLFHFGWQMGWPLFSIYQINNLKADEWWLTILTVTSNAVMFFSYNYWNKLIHRKGTSFVLVYTTFGMAITPILYMLSPDLYIMTITGLATGFFTAGTTVIILDALLEVAPENERILYVGIHATLTNITLAVAPLIGGYIQSRTNIYTALLVTSLFRFIGSGAFFIRNKKLLN